MKTDERLTAEICRQALGQFWDDPIDVAKTSLGVALALPRTHPHGRQVQVLLEPLE